jgi:hypothetical protein
MMVTALILKIGYHQGIMPNTKRNYLKEEAVRFGYVTEDFDLWANLKIW